MPAIKRSGGIEMDLGDPEGSAVSYPQSAIVMLLFFTNHVITHEAGSGQDCTSVICVNII
jgi:hypothetical protein